MTTNTKRLGLTQKVGKISDTCPMSGMNLSMEGGRKLRLVQRFGLGRGADVQPEAPAEVWLHEDRIA